MLERKRAHGAGHRVAQAHVGDLVDHRAGAWARRRCRGGTRRPPSCGGAAAPGRAPLSTSAFCARVGVLRRAARLDVLGQPVGVVVVEAVGGHARRVGDPLDARLGGLLEHAPRALHVQLARGVAGVEDRERQVHHDVGALDQRRARSSRRCTSPSRYSVFFQPCVGRVERAPRHAHDLASPSASARARPPRRCRDRRSGRSPRRSGPGWPPWRFYLIRRVCCPLFAAVEDVERVGDDGVVARAALHAVAPAVARVDLVVARAGGDPVGAASTGHLVVARRRCGCGRDPSRRGRSGCRRRRGSRRCRGRRAGWRRRRRRSGGRGRCRRRPRRRRPRRTGGRARCPPKRRSAPAWPKSVSLPEPPSTTSSPAPA